MSLKSSPIELHRHLDASVRSSTLLELAQERGLVPLSTSLDSFRESFFLKSPLSDLYSVLSKFTLFQQVLDRPDVLERVAFEAAEDCYNEGTRTVEFRFSPGFVCELSKLKFIDVLDGFDAGLKKAKEIYPDLKTGLICIGSRDLGMASIEKTVEFYLKNDDRLIGFDLAGDEVAHPNDKYATVIKPLLFENAPITIHAGEATGPESIWAAVELLGARRIGHGIHCVQDHKLMDFLRDQKILLEICPTSNWLTQAVPNLESHPIKKIIDHGIPVCINTDDPGIFDVTLPSEIAVAQKYCKLTDQDVQKTFEYAHTVSFLK